MNPESGNVSDDSDTSDEDYNPNGQAEELPSEVESDGDPEDDLPASENTSKRGKSKQNKRPTKKRKKASQKIEEPEIEEEPEKKNEPSEAELKKKSDSLWASFMSDTDFKPKPKSAETVKIASVASPKQAKITEKVVEAPKKVTITQIFEFAGEEVKVSKEVAADSAEARLVPTASGSTASTAKPRVGLGRGRVGLGGISSVLGQLGKKQKISTLEKSKLDWDSFKKEEDIEEEIQKHNKGKDGYLERQDFLERADLRRFEIEKEIRTVQRSNRRM